MAAARDNPPLLGKRSSDSKAEANIVPGADFVARGRRFGPLRSHMLKAVLRGQRGMRQLSRQFYGGWTRRGDTERFSQLIAVTGHNGDFTPAPQSAHVKQFLLHGIGGQNHAVNSLALAAVSSDCIAVIELAMVRRQGA
jgi:hypothetical protein